MSFISTTPAPVETPVTNDGFFPGIDPVKLRAVARLDGTVTADRLRSSILSAVMSTNRELAAYKAAQQLLGHATLASVPADQIDGASVQLSHYLIAVYSTVQAGLTESYRDADTTGAGDKAADKLELRTGDLRRAARWAVSDLLGIRRTTVELI